MRHYSTYQSQFIEMFSAMPTTPVNTYVDDSFPGEWGTEDTVGDGVKVIRTTNFTNSGKLNLTDVVTRSIEDRKIARKQIKKYDTILERSGGTADNPVGRVVLFEEDELFLCNNFTQILRFKDIDPRFAFYSLYYFYQTNKTAIRSMGSKTTGIQNLNMSKYLEIGIPNASDEEQNEYVAIAEQADKSKFTSLKSQFIEMIGSKNWPEAKLKDIVHEDCSISYGIVQPGDDIEDGVPIVRPVDMNDTHLIERESLKKTSREISDAYSRTILRGDEILICVRGTTGLISKAEGLQGCNVTRGITPLFFKPEYNKEYLYRAFLGEKVQTYIKDNTIGSTLKGINMGTLREMLVCIPTCDIQQKFVCIAEQADKSKYIN